VSEDSQKTIEAMASAGMHFGSLRSRRHPSVGSYIFGSKGRVEIVDLEKSLADINKAKVFIKGLASLGQQVLLVGNKNEAKGIIREMAESHNLPYVALRWIGGTLTNFDHIRKRVDRLLELRKQGTRGDLMKYTKRERAKITQEVKDLERYFTGIVNMSRLPGALFVVDPKKEKTSLAEAKALGIPVIALANTDCDVSKIDYPIVGNDKTTASISLVVQSLLNSYKEGVPV